MGFGLGGSTKVVEIDKSKIINKLDKIDWQVRNTIEVL
jgi:hypothetical protein